MSLSCRAILKGPTGIASPSYDVSAVTAGLVHIGLGGFHRAHFTRYTHDVMDVDPAELSWGIIGAGLRPSDTALLSALVRRDGLYTLVERDGRSETRTLIGLVGLRTHAGVSPANHEKRQPGTAPPNSENGSRLPDQRLWTLSVTSAESVPALGIASKGLITV